MKLPALLSKARGQSCVMCHADDGTIVSAHSNLYEHGRGMGLKSHDGMTAWLCQRCHYELDHGNKMTKEEKKLFTLQAICKTYMELWKQELITTKGKK